MHLKSLTLRGFKSFADPVTLSFEPGVTVIVGPNGSGKSNVVDACAWVLGAQGAKTIRSSKMDDVIFAGTTRRPPLGRAEVSLTIDNSDRRLGVDLSEITITRTLFRTGESEYQMNGASCRLLDIQELLSDAGVGRQQHVLVSQGQLAAILDARSEDRRMVIEEAAGVLKFRRRRERAERRLEATEANLLRLQDLQREVRRQLRPLERQAEAARRHGSLEEELRALRLHLAGRELDSLRRRLEEAERRLSGLAERKETLSSRLASLDELVLATEGALTAEQSSDVLGELSVAERVHERARGVANLIAERSRRVEASLAASAEADVVSSLESEAARLATELEAAVTAREELRPLLEELEVRGAPLAAERRQLVSERGGESDLAAASRLRSEREKLLEELSSDRQLLAKLSAEDEASSRQRERTRSEVASLEARAAQLERRSVAARGALEEAEASEKAAAKELSSREQEARQAAEEKESLRARREALEEALGETHARAGLERLSGASGVLGTLADLVEVDKGYERAFAASVEEASSAVVVAGRAEALSALEQLSSEGIEGAILPTDSGAPGSRPSDETGGLPPLRQRVRGTRPGIDSLLDRLVGETVVVTGGIAEAVEALGTADPHRVVVTTSGDRLSARGWRLGAGREGATRSALDAAKEALGPQEERSEEASLIAAESKRRWDDSRRRLAEVRRELDLAAAEESSTAAELDQATARLAELARESERLSVLVAEKASALGPLNERLSGLESSLKQAEGRAELARAEADELSARRTALDEALGALDAERRQIEMRLAGTKERESVLEERLAATERRLAGHEEARAEAAGRRQREEARAEALRRLGAVTRGLMSAVEESLMALRQRRLHHDEAVSEITDRLGSARGERSSAEKELSTVSEQSQRSELERTELRVRMETAVETIRHDLEAEVEQCLAAPLPELPPGTPPAARVRELERELRMLGPINSLALEELASLEERDQFLTGQLEDVRSSRRELQKVIKAVDEEIVSVFAEAFSDVGAHFEALFATLFPGGSGKLVLTEPDDILSSGVEIEARPAGRTVRRLSLLSGGERAMVSLAFLFAVFRSRPSPFYLMDEVEAALDDVNLDRFLDLLEEFRGEAQLIVVSHQKRTMDSADILYGVSMQPGGSSKVVSERLRREPASA